MGEIMSCKTKTVSYKNMGRGDLSTVNFPSLWAAMKDEVNRNARNETGPEADRETSTISFSVPLITVRRTKKDTMNNQNSLIIQ